MAGEKISRLYCWQTKIEELNIYLASSELGAVRVALGMGSAFDCVEYFKKVFQHQELVGDHSRNRDLLEAVEAVLSGHALPETLKLDVLLTPFQRAALETIKKIPFGQTRTYGQVALLLNKPGGARAVGQAMARNPLPLIFP